MIFSMSEGLEYTLGLHDLRLRDYMPDPGVLEELPDKMARKGEMLKHEAYNDKEHD